LRFLAWWRDDDRASLQHRLSAQSADEAFDALVAAREAVVIDEVLVDGFGFRPLLSDRSMKSK
jgi:hypothetical protein